MAQSLVGSAAPLPAPLRPRPLFLAPAQVMAPADNWWERKDQY